MVRRGYCVRMRHRKTHLTEQVFTREQEETSDRMMEEIGRLGTLGPLELIALLRLTLRSIAANGNATWDDMERNAVLARRAVPTLWPNGWDELDRETAASWFANLEFTLQAPRVIHDASPVPGLTRNEPLHQLLA